MTSVYGDLSRPPLNEAELVRALTTGRSRWSAVTVVAESPSTNAELSARGRQDPRDGLVLLAEHQTAGRGRLDRTWVTPPRAGITLSVLVRPAGVPVARWTWVPLLSGLAVAAAVQQVAGVPATVKWPNDVMVDDRKLAGLLVERVDSGGSAAAAGAVIGIGLNVTTTRAELPVPRATSLVLEAATTTDRLTLVKAILRRLDGLLAEWESGGGVASAALQDAYREASSTIGRHVNVELPRHEPVSGVAAGVDATGRLLVDTGSGRVVFGAGDVLHVRRRA